MNAAQPRTRVRWVRVLGCALFVASLATEAAAEDERLPPSPYEILGVRVAGPPTIDAVSLCVPSDDDRLAGALVLFERAGPEPAMEALKAVDVEQEGRDTLASDLAVLRASLGARRAGPAVDAAASLRTAAESANSPRAEACAWLELARFELATGRLPEARTDAKRALRAYANEPAPGPVRRASAHYRAESLYRSGQLETARSAFEALAVGATPVARAAGLRIADLDYLAEPSREHREDVEALLTAESQTVSPVERWGARIAEWALAEGDPASALAWLERVPQDLPGPERTAVAIRRADSLYLLGRAAEGEAILRRLANEGATEPLRQLATVRLIDLDSPPGERPVAHLRRAAESELRPLMLYARAILSERLSAAGDDTAALDALVEMSYENAPESIVGSFEDRLDEVLASIASRGDCVEILTTIGGRRTLLLERAGVSEPFLQLGDCYLELGMARAAHDVYRAANRRFGPELAREITLRSARAELGIGQVDPARAAARANIQLITVPVREWRLLYGDILIGDGRPDAAIPVLTPVARDVAEGTLTGPSASRAIWLITRAALDHGSTPALRALIRDGLARIADQPTADAPLAETQLVAAKLHRVADDRRRARRLYGLALEGLPAGPLHSMAGYWHGVLASDIDDARAAWKAVPESTDAWARLAESELALSRTRAALGRVQKPTDPVSSPVEEVTP